MPFNPSDVNVWRSPDLKAELLRGTFVDFSYDVHTHDTACFALLTEGNIRIRTRGNEFIARRGDLYAIDADEPHAGWPITAQGWSLRTLYVDIAYLHQLVDERGARHALTISGPIIRDPQINAILYALHRSSETQGSLLFRDQAYLAFSDTLMKRYVKDAAKSPDGGPELGAVRRARAFLDEHLGDRVSLIDIAVQTGIPPFRLLRAFEREYGMTPHAYQRQARVRYAMHLIRHRCPLSQAGILSGFADQAHFTRWFRRFMGVTPGQYQKALHGV
ncbi:helix-turn-helix domain-containing protein [Sodalis sp. RH24]|uniref:helix-turn-helix domain-containing protein n=1 Tax=unclassified Sodalis (in: enterobacteria) TaxID=2636512 RepID=UPI0039B66195